jgi:hypothetical protein
MHTEGYSMPRILLAGLISPTLVLLFLFIGFYIAEWMLLAPIIKFAVSLSTSIVGFIVGTILLIRLSGRILKFATVMEKC